jgi:biopolymer transport protein ExbB
MLEQILKGGPLMVPIMACSLVSLAVVYDRWCAFRENRKIDTRALRSKVLAYLRANNLDAAISECAATGGPLASVMLAGLRSYQQLKEKNENPETMRLVVGQVMDEYSAQALSVVNKRLDVLTTVGTAAPLLGMTGTVTGMIGSFAGMAEAGASGAGGGAVAAGIAEALITTAAGLLIALSAVVPQSVFNRWSDEIELEIQEANSEIVEFILTHH